MKYTLLVITVFLPLALGAQEFEELDAGTADQPSMQAEIPNLDKGFTSVREEPIQLIRENLAVHESEIDSDFLDKIEKDHENVLGDMNFFNFLKIFSAQLLKPSTADNESGDIGDDLEEDDDEEEDEDDDPETEQNSDYAYIPTIQGFSSYRNSSSTSRS